MKQHKIIIHGAPLLQKKSHHPVVVGGGGEQFNVAIGGASCHPLALTRGGERFNVVIGGKERYPICIDWISSGYRDYYLYDWADAYMADLLNHTLSNMSYGEVIK